MLRPDEVVMSALELLLSQRQYSGVVASVNRSNGYTPAKPPQGSVAAALSVSAPKPQRRCLRAIFEFRWARIEATEREGY